MHMHIIKVLILITFATDIISSANEINKTPIKITHLHEVNEQPIIEKSTNEYIVPKPIRKKPYAILEKPSEIDKQRQKELQSNSEILDLNIDHLEDEHQSIKNIGLSAREQDLLSDDDTHSDIHVEHLIAQSYPSTTITNNILENPNIKENSRKLHTSIHLGNTVTSQKTEITTNSDVKTAVKGNSFGGSNSNSNSGSSNSNIFKVAKNKSKNKGLNIFRKLELQKNYETNHFNSLNKLPLSASTQSSSSSSSLSTSSSQLNHHNAHFVDNQSEENIFHILVNAYDHFYWQPSEIRTKLTPVCGVELLAYLSALNNNIDWAQKAYDASGHYRAQIFFGNNLWLGQKLFCNEVNYNLNERKHFEFSYSVSTISFKVSLPTNVSNLLQLGECLPKSCNALDIRTILEADPHIRYLMSMNSTATNFQILKVRHVPGDYNIWKEMKFKIFCAFIVFMIALISYASWLEIYIKNRTRDQLQKKIPNISEKYESEKSKIKKLNNITELNSNNGNNGLVDTGGGFVTTSSNNNEKITFELYQMDSTNIEDNNNIDIEVISTDLEKFNRNENENYIRNRNENVNCNGNGNVMENCSNRKINENGKKINGIDIVSIANSKRSLGFIEKLILCFSFPTNVSTICSFNRKNEEILSCVHGIRVFSLLWTIMVHTYLQMFLIGENRFKRNVAERAFAYQVIGNATFSVDSFFFLSGLLVVLIFLRNAKRKEMNSKEFIKKGCSKSFFLILYRYIRLTPAYLFVIIFTELSLNFVFNRTVHIPTTANIACRNYWWRNILYINNFYPFSELCMIWSWYLANDMQFYILAVILLVLSTRYLKFSIITTFALLFISWGTAGVVSIHYQYMHKVSDPFESFDFLYDKPWQRIGPYIVGMITGYIVFKYKTPPKVPFLLNILLWILSLGLLFILIFGVWNGQLSILITAFYVSIGHTAWGLGLVWITLSCYWNLSPIINKFFSYELFLPLSRLTYCTYLIHPTIMMITSFLMEGAITLQHTFILTVFLGNAVLSIFVAFLISVAFESPIIRLTKLFMNND